MTRLWSGLIYRLGIAALLAPMVLMLSGRAPEALAFTSVTVVTSLTQTCPSGTTAGAVYGDDASELQFGFIKAGTVGYGGGTITVTPNGNKTSMTWSLSGTSSFVGVDHVLVWGVNAFTGQHNGKYNQYNYSPEATSEASPLTDDTGPSRITHVVFCGDSIGQLGTIGGTKWNDKNADLEILTAGEGGIGFWPINLHSGACPPSGAPIATTMTTVSTGTYSFPTVAVGTYCVAEAPPLALPAPPMTQTAPSGGSPSLFGGAESVNPPDSGSAVANYWQIVVTESVPGVSGVNFGNRGFGCPPGLPIIAEWGDAPNELSGGFIRDTSHPLAPPLPFGAATINITPSAFPPTSFSWSLSGVSGIGGVDAVVVWGKEAPPSQLNDGATNIYQYSPEATSDAGPLTDNNPAHPITHVLFCGDTGGSTTGG